VRLFYASLPENGGVLPQAGGWLDQAALMIDAFDYCRAARAHIRAEHGALDERQQLAQLIMRSLGAR